MRDWRKNQAIKMDPNTVDIIWEMHEELGSKEPVHIICGYRSRDTNDMLRRTRGGQASQKPAHDRQGDGHRLPRRPPPPPHALLPP